MKAPLVFYPKKSTLQILAVGSGLVLATSIFIMFSIENLQYGILRLVALVGGFLGCSLGGALFLLTTGRLFRPQPLLRVDEEGLAFHQSQFANARIPWSEVKSYSLVKRGPRKFILVLLHHPQQLLNGVEGLRRRRLRTNMRHFKTPFAVPVNLLDGDAESVLHQIRDWRN